MAMIKNSPLLDEVLQRAKLLNGGEDASLTAEGFLLATADALDGTYSYQTELEDLSRLMHWAQESTYQTLAALREYLEGRLAEKKSEGRRFSDGLYMQRIMLESRRDAANDGQKFLDVNWILKSILEDAHSPVFPVENTQEQKAKAQEEAKPVPEQPQEDAKEQSEDTQADRRFDEIFGMSEKKQDNPKDTVKGLTERIKEMQDRLKDVIFGQDHAINVFTAGYFQAELSSMTDKKRVRPKATFLFAGPPGVGKTFLAEKAAEALALPFMRFDMSEYADKEASVEFCGSDKVYKNAKAGNVTGFVEAHPKCVLLFDEIEKSHISVIHLFLQLLDAGRLRDNYTDNEVSFADAVLIFTTNAGKQLYEADSEENYAAYSRKVILKALQKDVDPSTGNPFFPAAICSRFASGNVVMFNHITARDLHQIARREILRHAENFSKEIGIHIEIDERVYTALLYAEGGSADARMIRSRAEAFFDGELFELFRLLSSKQASGDISALDGIRFGVKLPKEGEIATLFQARSSLPIPVLAGDKVYAKCKACADDAPILKMANAEDILAFVKKNEVEAVLLELGFDQTKGVDYLNREDISTPARDLLYLLKQKYADIPVYLLLGEGTELTPEEIDSFRESGARGVISVAAKPREFAQELHVLRESAVRQRGMNSLCRSNRALSFRSAQKLSADGRNASILLYDFAMTVDVEAEDAGSMVNGMQKPSVTFDSVIGAEDAKKELKYFISYLKEPKRFAESGLRAPKGVLLYGPPGTGKTLLAKAMAGESNATFFIAEGNQFLKKYVGEGPEKVHELFRAARKYAPSIIFIDEIDAIAKERRGGERAAAGEETLTALLTEMEGFTEDPTKPVFVLAATNFEVEPGTDRSLDAALLRRFDRRLYIDLPNRAERMQFMHQRTEGQKIFCVSEEKLDNLAVRSTGMSLSELESVFSLAQRSAIRDGGLRVTDEILEEAFETFHSGERQTWDSALLERVARHEAGHALVSFLSGNTPSYVTVVARAGHGGYVQQGDSEGHALYTRQELLARIRTALAGRAAEMVYYGEEEGISTGASGDLASATDMARRMICAYGMDSTVGLGTVDTIALQSDALLAGVQAAVNRILAVELEAAHKAINENRAGIDALVELLLAQNHLSGAQVTAALCSAGVKV